MSGLSLELKVARIRQSKKQTDIAEKLGISLGTYQKYENDPTTIPLGTVIEIVEYLSDDILTGQLKSAIGG